MNFAGNSQQCSDTDVFESLRKGQALADVAAALLTGIATLHLPTISSGFQVWWAHLRLPGTAASHRDLGCSSSYHLTPGGACVCETWAESHSSVLLLSLSLA